MRDETVHITQNERFYALFDVLSLYLGIKRIQSDLEYLFYDKWHRTKMDHFIVSSPDNISHVSHVGGCRWLALFQCLEIATLAKITFF